MKDLVALTRMEYSFISKSWDFKLMSYISNVVSQMGLIVLLNLKSIVCLNLSADTNRELKGLLKALLAPPYKA